MIAKGKHNAKVTGASFGTSSNNNEQVAIQFEITDGDFAGECIACIAAFTEDATEYTVEKMRNCGWDGDDIREFKTLADTGQLGPVVIVVEHEEYKGNLHAKVKFVNKPGGGRFKFKDEIGEAGLDTMAARLKSAFRGGPRPAARSSSNQRPAAGGSQQRGGGNSGRDAGRYDDRPPPDDDIPFATCSIAADPSPISRALRCAP